MAYRQAVRSSSRAGVESVRIPAMLKSSTLRSVWIWLAAFAVLLSAIAPTISHASRSVRGVDLDYISICTTSGMKWVDVKTGETLDTAPDSAEVDNQPDRCDGCLSHPHALLPHSFESSVQLVLTQSEKPFLFFHAPKRLYAWSQANPRAPPLV